MQPLEITVISSFAEDEIFYTEFEETEIHKGGPALWIIKALESLNFNPRVFTGKLNAKVKIIRENMEERGSIVSVEPIILPSLLSADLFIISTISDEFNLENIKKIHGTVALDIQGYARKLKNTNKKLMIPKEIVTSITMLKGTETEVACLEDEFLNDQKRRTLIITKGETGFDIFFHEKKYEFAANRIFVKNTIGAGDSFFTAFAVEFLRTNNILKSGEFGKVFVEKFLKAKLND